MISEHSHRKNEHISLAEKFHQNQDQAFQAVRFIHQSLPNFNVADVDLSTHLGPLKLNIPFYIEAMSGGSDLTKKINQRLSYIAKETNLAMAVGSQSIALYEPDVIDSFTVVRQNNPQGIIFANIGANNNVDDAQRAVDMLQADALEIHVNVAQELIMPEGDRQFNFQHSIQQIVQAIPIPVIVKEVGFGMSQETIQQLINLGVQYINVSGRGGTNFAKIENFRRSTKEMAYLADWGQTTLESLFEAQKFRTSGTLLACGGIKSPLDVAKCLTLGCSAVGIAGEFLHYLIHNKDDQEIIKIINNWIYGLKSIFVLTNSHNIAELQRQHLILNTELQSYLQQRNIHY